MCVCARSTSGWRERTKSWASFRRRESNRDLGEEDTFPQFQGENLWLLSLSLSLSLLPGKLFSYSPAGYGENGGAGKRWTLSLSPSPMTFQTCSHLSYGKGSTQCGSKVHLCKSLSLTSTHGELCVYLFARPVQYVYYRRNSEDKTFLKMLTCTYTLLQALPSRDCQNPKSKLKTFEQDERAYAFFFYLKPPSGPKRREREAPSSCLLMLLKTLCRGQLISCQNNLFHSSRTTTSNKG